MNNRTLIGGFAFVTFLLVGLSNTPAAEFYSGKNIRFIVGFAAGGGYDAYDTSVGTFPVILQRLWRTWTGRAA